MTETLDIKISKVENSRLPQTDFTNLPFGQIFTDHMLVADYADGEWKNFEIKPYGEIGFSPAISALHYGQAFFEGLKAYKHADGKVTVFRADKNAARFNKSAERLCMPQLPEETFVNSCLALVDVERDWIPTASGHSLYLRPVMFATDPMLGVTPSKTYKFVILACPVGAYFSKPLRVKFEDYYTRAAEGGFGYAKAAGNYGGSMLPFKKAAEEGFDQLIWTDAKEHLYAEEMGAANVMFVLNGVLVTPSTRDTILDGVTRDTVLTLARDWGMPVEERRVSIAEIVEGARNGSLTDAFGAGTAATIAPVGALHYKGEDFTLSDPATREFSQKVLKELTAIRYGNAPDTHNWNYAVA